mgnify:CR=1 FL=1
MKIYLDLIDSKDGTTRERAEITHLFTRLSPSCDRKTNDFFLDCWLADRTKELKRQYFPRKKGFLMLWMVDDNGTSVGFSKWRIDSVAIEK